MATALKNLSDFSNSEVPSAKGYKFGIVAAEWNQQITGKLLEGAVDTLIKYGAAEENISFYPVPGSYELTLGAQLLLETGKFDAVIALGCLIQGETKHFDFISQAVAQGLTNAGLKYNRPVVFGVLTTDTLQQALERAGGIHGNKGDEAAATAIKMVDLANTLKR